MRAVIVVANLSVELGHAGLAIGDYHRGIVEVAHALLLGAVFVRGGVAVLRSLHNGLADLLALLGDSRRAHVCDDADDVGQQGNAGERK